MANDPLRSQIEYARQHGDDLQRQMFSVLFEIQRRVSELESENKYLKGYTAALSDRLNACEAELFVHLVEPSPDPSKM